MNPRTRPLERLFLNDLGLDSDSLVLAALNIGAERPLLASCALRKKRTKPTFLRTLLYPASVTLDQAHGIPLEEILSAYQSCDIPNVSRLPTQRDTGQ